MNKLLPLALALFLLSCGNKNTSTQNSQPSGNAKDDWTKPLITFVDAPTTYYDNPDDEDFSQYSALVSKIFDAVYAGKLQAYHFIDGSPLSIEEIKKAANSVDTLFVENPNTQEFEMKIVQNDWAKNIVSVKLKETWRFNKETLQLEKKVLGLAPRVPVHNQQTGELRGYTPLFWVFFDKEAETAFAKK